MQKPRRATRPVAMEIIEPRPNARGYYGRYGGRFVPESLMPACLELERAYQEARADPLWQAELDRLLAQYVGRPSPVHHAARLSAAVGGAAIYLKREDLNHTGAHKINNALGQGLLARRMGKPRLIAETGAGQHGVASATVAAQLGLECVVYMGSDDVRRQRPNVFWMEQLGATVVPVNTGSRMLKDAVNQALRDWVANLDSTHYLLGSVLGPHPYPLIVRDFQAVIGREARQQLLDQSGKLPDVVVACVGGGSNAMGIFSGFLPDPVELVGVEAGGRGPEPGEHAARFAGGRLGVLHGAQTYLLTDDDGQILPTHSISAGLDYPAVGPEHSWLHETGRARYTRVGDQAALDAFRLLARTEGILCALESAHAVATALDLARERGPDATILVNLSGRGDKDIFNVARAVGDANFTAFLRQEAE